MDFDKIAADNTFDAIIIFSAKEKKIVYVNRAFTKIYGYTNSEALASSLEILKGGADSTKALDEQLSFGIHFFLDSTFYRKNNQEIHVLVHYSPILDDKGNITHWTAVHQQNVAHKKFQSSISRISNYLNMVVENAPINVWALDMQGVIKLMMGSLLLPPNMKAEDCIDKSAFDVYSDNSKLLIDINNALNGNLSRSINLINKSYFESHFAQLNDNSGKCIGLIIVSININERIEAEEVKTRLSSILEATTDLVGISDDTGQMISYINSAGVAMLGRDAEFIKSMPIRAFHPPWALKIIEEVAIPEAMKNGVWSGETALVSSSGEEIPISQVLIVHKTPDGKFQRLSTIARDIREIKLNERRLLEARDKAEAATKAKSEFLANISHEIRTPLNAILGFSEILSKSTTDLALQKYSKSICDSGKNLLLLLNDILDLSKIESGKLELKNQLTSTQEILSEIKTMFSVPCQAKGLQLEVDIPQTKNPIEIDSTRLRQVLFNLVGNAIKYTKKGFACLSVDEKFDEKNGTVTLVFKVQDSGLGIEIEDQVKIFETFFQKNDYAGGAGLGLSISQRLVQMMGGTITVQSKRGEGSTFTVTIPNVKIGKARNGIQSPFVIKPLDAIDFKGATIIIADDVLLNLEVIKLFLKNANVKLLEAHDGLELLNLVELHSPNLIILDLKMPKMDGYEAATRLKANPKTKHIPIIVITAMALREEGERVSRIGCDSFLLKPINRNALIDELKRFLPYVSNL